jgi:hypothetical protein
MNSLNKVLLILLIAAAAAAGAIAWSGSRELRVANAAVEDVEQQLEEIKKKLTEASFKYRGIAESMENVPDSLRMTVTGEYRRKQQSYQKIVIGYEHEQREAERIKRKREREADAVRKRLYLRLLLAGGAAVLLAGALFTLRTIRS